MATFDEKTGKANNEALRRIVSCNPVLVGVKRASDIVPSMVERDLVHAGPPLEGWHEACGALRGATVGTILHAGLAKDAQAAEAMAASGEFSYVSANELGLLGTFAGVIRRTTPVFVVKDSVSGRVAGAAINEGRGKALRYGSIDNETLSRLDWIEHELSGMLDEAIRLTGGIPLIALIEQALHMGDDGHSRQKAASALFLNTVSAPLVDAGYGAKETARAMRFLATNDIFCLPITIAAAKVAMSAAHGVPDSTLVTCMASNGIRFGIQVSGIKDRWFTAPVPDMQGRYFEGFTAQQAGPLIGDSVISETSGLGAFAMPAAPALAAYVGGSPDEANRLALEMYGITIAEHPRYKIPALNYRGTPFGIDAARVVERKIAPIFNAGIAHRNAGVGQIGAGFGRAPLRCFEQAIDGFRH